ncbi:MAG: TetR/AcrR family transcriptional regulator [Spirochaetales bacterium]|nr:TetR/AcrR family transcriptional regulator [Spirochaetales bacterium]
MIASGKKIRRIRKGKRKGTGLENDLAAMPEGQRKIFEAAVDEFAERGFAGSSTLAIAARAGVSEGLIFKYFKSKAALLRQVVFPVLATTIMPLAIRGIKGVADADHETFAGFLEDLIHERLEFARRHKKHLRILLQELPFHEELRERILKGMRAELLPVLSQKISQFQKQGDLRTMPVDQMLSYLGPQIMGFVLSRALFSMKFAASEEEDVKTLIVVMLNGVAAPIEATRRVKK